MKYEKLLKLRLDMTAGKFVRKRREATEVECFFQITHSLPYLMGVSFKLIFSRLVVLNPCAGAKLCDKCSLQVHCKIVK